MSSDVRKKVLFLQTGPPTTKPASFCLSELGLPVVSKKVREFSASLRRYQKTDPWKLFVPDFSVISMLTPPLKPDVESAFAVKRNSSMASGIGLIKSLPDSASPIP